METRNTKAAGLRTTAAQENTHAYLTIRLAHTKRLLVEAYNLDALTFGEAESLARRLRQRYENAWRSA